MEVICPWCIFGRTTIGGERPFKLNDVFTACDYCGGRGLIRVEANKKEECDFDIMYRGEKWHITNIWIQQNGETAWYDGETVRDGVKFMRLFDPTEVLHPEIGYRYTE